MRRRSAWLALASIAVLGAGYFLLRSLGSGGGDEATSSLAGASAEASAADSAALERELATERGTDSAREVVPFAEATPAGPNSTVLHPPADAATLLVQTVDKLSHAPIPGLRINASKKGDDDAAPAEDIDGSKGDLTHPPLTDPDGRAEVSVPPGVDLELWFYDVQGRCQTLGVDVTPLRTAERRELVVEIATGDDLHVFGKVVDDVAGGPIAGARVLLSRAEPRTGQDIERNSTVLSRTTTGQEGEFELRMSSWKQDFLRVEADGFAFATLRRVEGHDSPDRPLEVRMVRPASLEARVVDPAGGAVPDVLVRLVAKGYALPPRATSASGKYVDVPDERWVAITGADGRCTVGGLCPEVELAVELVQGNKLRWREPEPVILARGQVLDREWVVGGGCTLRGLALDQDSKPVAGLELWLMRGDEVGVRYFQTHERERVSAKAMTDQDGRFHLENVEPGTWWLGPAPYERGWKADASGRMGWETPSANAIAPAATRIEILSAGTQEVTLRLFRGIYIRGRVVDPDGRGVNEAWVTASGAGGPWGSNCGTDRDGAFIAGPLQEGAYSLVAEASDRFPECDPVAAHSGDVDVVLRLRAGGGIRARVVDARTGNSCAAELLLSPHLPGTGNIHDGVSWGVNEKGVVDWQGLLPGSYDLAASTEDGGFGVLTGIGVVAGEKGKELVLSVAPGGRLKMTYDGPQEHVTVHYLLDGARVDWGEPVTRGRMLERAAPAGALTLVIESDDENARPRKRVVHLDPGQTKEIQIQVDD